MQSQTSTTRVRLTPSEILVEHIFPAKTMEAIAGEFVFWKDEYYYGDQHWEQVLKLIAHQYKEIIKSGVKRCRSLEHDIREELDAVDDFKKSVDGDWGEV